MNDDLMLEYMLSMGAMQPEQVEMLRKQKMIDALRERSMSSPEGQMVGKTFVAPSITQYAAQALNGYMAGQQQKKQDAGMVDFNNKRLAELRKMQEEIQKRKRGLSPATPSYDAYGDVPTFGPQ